VSHDLLDLPATPERLQVLARAGVIPRSHLERALQLAVASPERPAWRRFLSTVLMGFGALLVLSGVIYFFAYNWAELHRFAKLGLILAAITASAVTAWRLGETLPGQFALLFAAVLVGPLLAVYGQAYQTGADPYQLFLGWSLLILPWVALARFSPLWLLLLLLVNTGLSLYWDQAAEADEAWLAFTLALVNGAAWGAYEFLSWREVSWLQGRWLPRVLALMTMFPLLILGEQLVLDSRDAEQVHGIGTVLLLVLMAATYAFHRLVRAELFLLTLVALCAMTLLSTLAGHFIFGTLDMELPGFFLMGLILIGEVGLAVLWLRAEARGPEEV
jgi:uncharacterized membrane protein